MYSKGKGSSTPTGRWFYDNLVVCILSDEFHDRILVPVERGHDSRSLRIAREILSSMNKGENVSFGIRNYVEKIRSQWFDRERMSEEKTLTSLYC